MKRRAVIVFGGWPGHQPERVADHYASVLGGENFEVTRSESLDTFADLDFLKSQDLILPHWTMDTLTPEQLAGVVSAVRDHGVGLAGCHGGMGDAFRMACEWQFMVGGQFVAHPGNAEVTYPVRFRRGSGHPLVEGLPDFELTSEQYYMHVDPGVTVLATTPFPIAEGPHQDNPCDMPAVWVKRFGEARVFYTTIGHFPEDLMLPESQELLRRAFVWTART
ncbi:MAG TPA: ThuA domain-containing protein [Fimbriimonadaceae bacterium]|nr:ThuA domain-containing protein [Fimbriimonadaceae bacterium]HRJ32577.1 ThuA domain-containing protein [Fimbriimonadaceae bacterium]